MIKFQFFSTYMSSCSSKIVKKTFFIPIVLEPTIGNNPNVHQQIMDNENVVYTDSEILLSLKKEGNPVICNDTDELGGHYAKCNKPVTEGQMLHDSTYI